MDTFRTAEAGAAESVAQLHADSWRRHYRGVYADSFLDGDILTDRRRVWSARLAAPSGALTVLAEDEEGLAGFVHLVPNEDTHWGSLVDNLHIRLDRQRSGLGSSLLRRAAAGVVEGARTRSMYLWVQEQNQNAQRFYAAMGGTCVEKALIRPPGGVPGRLVGTPAMLRIAWPDVAVAGLVERRSTK